VRVPSVLAALAAAVLALTAPAGPALARADAGPAMAPCVVPSFETVQRDDLAPWLVLFGGATDCPPRITNAGFRIATYYPDRALGDAPGYNIRRLYPVLSGAGADSLFGTAVAPATPGVYGVCLLAAGNRRVACGLITATAGTPALTVTFAPLPVDDPLVSRDVVTTPWTGDVAPPGGGGHHPGNSCGTCF
jgi:hypothetical protein